VGQVAPVRRFYESLQCRVNVPPAWRQVILTNTL
jgi:hypothetical protein